MGNISELLNEHSQKIVRGQLRKIVEIYDQDWIVAHELVQNAIDAAQADDSVPHGLVTIELNVDTDTVTVEDNGPGFKHDLNLLCPGGSGEEKRLSSRSSTKGYQGVGLKAVMYSTQKFELESRTRDELWTFTAENLCDFVKTNSQTDPEYLETITNSKSEDTFTRIVATFPGHQVRRFLNGLNRFLNEDSVKWHQLYDEIGQHQAPVRKYLDHFLGWYFRSTSYVGCVNRLLNVEVRNPNTNILEAPKPIDVTLRLCGSGLSSLEGSLGSWLKALGEHQKYEVVLPNKAWDYAEIAMLNSQRPAKYKIAPEIVTIGPGHEDWEKLAGTFRDKFLSLKLRPNSLATGFREKYADFIQILERPRSNVKAEEFACLFEQITGIYLAIGRTSSFEMLGLQNNGMRLISSNGTPTAHELTVRSTSSTWYLETIHFVVNVDATLNLGKRHLANTRLVGDVRNFFEACYPKLVSMSKLFVERQTFGSGTDTMQPLLGHRSINRRGLGFKRFPVDENTLIGLFSATISQVYSDFSIFGYYGRATYDGKFGWDSESPSSDADMRILEFKLNLRDFIDECERAFDQKEFDEIDLVVVWDRRISVPGWDVKGISRATQNELASRRIPTDLIEYVVENRQGRKVPLISVPELIAQLPLAEGQTDDLEAFIKELR